MRTKRKRVQTATESRQTIFASVFSPGFYNAQFGRERTLCAQGKCEKMNKWESLRGCRKQNRCLRLWICAVEGRRKYRFSTLPRISPNQQQQKCWESEEKAFMKITKPFDLFVYVLFIRTRKLNIYEISVISWHVSSVTQNWYREWKASGDICWTFNANCISSRCTFHYAIVTFVVGNRKED